MPPEQAADISFLPPTHRRLFARRYSLQLSFRPTSFSSGKPCRNAQQVLENEAVPLRQLNAAVPRDLDNHRSQVLAEVDLQALRIRE